MSPFAGSRRGASRPTPSLLADRERSRGADLRLGHDGADRRSDAVFSVGCTRSPILRSARLAARIWERRTDRPALLAD
jgi:hypothetical protein